MTINKYYVYEWIRLDTYEPFYIGKGKDNRCYSLTRGKNNHFNNIVKSIPCVVNILHKNIDEDTAFGLEIYYIWLYRDVIGYELCNLTDGGEGTSGLNPIERMSDVKRKERSNKLREANIGENNPMFGMCGDKNPFYGKQHTDEVKEKISKANKGRSFKRTEENKMKISKARKKKVICITTNEIFDSAQEASIYYNLDKGAVSKCCRGKQKTAGKLTDGTKLVWKYLNDVAGGMF